jgi:hypothetical protein
MYGQEAQHLCSHLPGLSPVGGTWRAACFTGLRDKALQNSHKIKTKVSQTATSVLAVMDQNSEAVCLISQSAERALQRYF